MHILTADKAGNKTETVKGPITVTKVMAKVGQIVTGENKEYTKNGGTAIIPVGFAIKPGCDDISQGLVISDVANDTNDTGNQFVWIPVASTVNYVNNVGAYPIYYTDVSSIGSSNYLPSGVSNEKTAVVSAGGFYIARYETGTGRVSKKGVSPWVSITVNNAKNEARNFVNNSYIKSALVSGVQWDLVMDFVSGKNDGTGQKFYPNSPSTSRHLGSIKATGQNNADKVCNIYDLEGNCGEWSTEYGRGGNFSWNWEFYRGGSYVWQGNWEDRASVRRPLQPDMYPYSVSFRIVLYVMK